MPKRYRSVSADEIELRLARKFAAPEWAFMPQLNQGTGAHAGRRADGVAMSLWPSRGIRLHGFEIKVSRGDFLSELKNPAKADAIQRYCHHWWLVTPPEVVLETDLLPSTWGHMEMFGTGLKIKRQAPETTPEALTLTAIAAMFRAFQETIPYLTSEYVHKSEVDKRVNEEVQAQILKRDPAVRELTRLREQVAAYEKCSGLTITDGWIPVERVGAVAKILTNAELGDRLAKSLEFPKNRLLGIAHDLGTVISALREAHQPLLPTEITDAEADTE